MARKYEVSLDLRSNFEKSLKKIDGQIRKVEKSVGNFGGATNKITGLTNKLGKLAGLNPYAAAAAGVAALGAAAFGAVAGANALNQQLLIAEERTGIAAERLAEYEALLRQTTTGVDFEELQEAITNVSERFGEAAQDAGGIRDAMNALGFSNQEIIDLSQLATAEEQFLAFSQSVQDLPEAELTFRLKEIGGDDLFRVKGLLKALGDEGSEAQKKIDRLDLAFSKEGIDNLKDFNNQAKLVNAIFSDISKEVGGKLAPTITAVAKVFINWVDLLGGTETIVDAIGRLFNVVLIPIRVAAEIILTIQRFLFGVRDIVANLGPLIRESVVKAFNDAKDAAEGFVRSLPAGGAVLDGLAATADAAGSVVGAIGDIGSTAGTAFGSLSNSLKGQISEWKGNEDAAAQYREEALRGAEAVRGGAEAVKTLKVEQQAATQAAEAMAQANEQAQKAIDGQTNSFRAFSKQITEQFGEIKIDVVGNAKDKLSELNAQYDSLKKSLVDDKIEALPLDLSNEEFDRQSQALLDQFEETFKGAYGNSLRSLKTFINSSVDQFDTLKAVYSEVEAIQLASEKKIANFRNQVLAGNIDGSQLQQLVELEEKFTADKLSALNDRNAKTAAAEANRLKSQADTAAKEVQAIADRRDALLSEVSKFGEIDSALSSKLDEINKSFKEGGLTGDQASTLKLVANVEAQVNKDQFEKELQLLNAQASDLTAINLGVEVSNTGEVLSEFDRIFSQVESDRAEIEKQFQDTFRIDPAAATALKDALSAEVDVQGAEALQNLLKQIGGVDIAPKVNLVDGIEDELRQIEAPLLELEQKLQAAINLGDTGTQRSLELAIDIIETEGYSQFIDGIEGGFDSIVRLDIEAPDNSILNGFVDSPDTNIGEFVKQFEDAQKAFNKSLAGQDQSFINTAQLEFEAERATAILGNLSELAPRIDFDTIGTAEQLGQATAEVKQFEGLIRELQLKFPEIDFSAMLSGADSAMGQLGDIVTSQLSDIIGSIGSGGSAISDAFSEQISDAFGGGALGEGISQLASQFESVLSNGFAQSAQIENQKFQESLNAFKEAETEKSAFAQAQQAFRDATSSEDVGKATENLNALLQKYKVTNDELNQLGLDRSSSAQQIASAVAGARQFETEQIRKQAAAQEREAKKAFEADKAFRTAQAIITGIQATVNAYEWGSKFGGPLGGGVAAGIAAFATAQQVRAIQSTSFKGSGGVTAPSSGGGGVASAGNNSSGVGGAGGVDSANDTFNNSGRSRSQVNIDFQGRSSISTEEAIELVRAIKDAEEEGYDLEFTR